MIRIYMTSGAWHELDRDVDEFGKAMNRATAANQPWCEIEGWCRSDGTPNEGRLLLNINHIERISE